ncbi:unnamed protein product (macronuclear) [Paramecium tetraurelia]|uniref:Major facilitator superfamily (MFS) profile domain-containing protein n=1 Tax=Paramecium tetraurelia TaxID=5888 RepID=A0BIQ6_PARTE|nr:uncharacterized protein GSPATT00004795001 [Paramecium tetraurelia]CAK58423.1 unnamed protein product [Paramecium tetraurelia]|eukprot:XP_001425821.1 hypothetical protein (macronuclear) [Paramecium tetraurelia strain d4-2]
MIVPEGIPRYRVFKSRWLVLFAFCFFTFTNAFGFVQYSPILTLASEYYGVQDEDIVWFSNCYYLSYFAVCPFTIKPLEKRLDLSLIFASLITMIDRLMDDIYLQIVVLSCSDWIYIDWSGLNIYFSSTCMQQIYSKYQLSLTVGFPLKNVLYQRVWGASLTQLDQISQLFMLQFHLKVLMIMTEQKIRLNK